MMSPSSRIWLSLLLSAVMLAGTLVPSGVMHSHGGLDGPFDHHQHDQWNELGITSRQRYDEDVDHRHDLACVKAAWTPTLSALDEIRHLHLTLLGIDFTFPDPNGPASDADDPRPNDMVLVRVSDDFLPSARSGTGFDRLSVSSDWLALQPYDMTAPQAVSQSPPPVTTVPLCDTARLERSGVRLA